MGEELATTQQEDIVPAEPPSVMALLQQAISQGIGVEQIEKLVDLEERISKRLAAQEFAGAMASFQQDCPPVIKNRTGDIKTRSGATYSYDYANTADIIAVVRPVLYKHGLSFTWDGVATDTSVTETCILRHVNGHWIQAQSTMPTASAAGMSEQQKCEAASTYAQRGSLSKVLGIVTSGAAPPPDDPGPPITEPQKATIEKLLAETESDIPKFLEFARVQSVDEITQRDFPRIVAALNKKVADQAKDQAE